MAVMGVTKFERFFRVAASLDVVRRIPDQDGVCERALFVIDENGTIAWSYCSPLAVNPGADGILDALEALPPAAEIRPSGEK